MKSLHARLVVLVSVNFGSFGTSRLCYENIYQVVHELFGVKCRSKHPEGTSVISD